MQVELRTNRYFWKSGTRKGAKDAAAFGAALKQIGAQPGEETTNAQKDALIAMARPEDSPLHPHFTWDDALCGLKQRREEARYFIRHLCVEVVINEQFTRQTRYAESVHIPLRIGEDGEEITSPQWMTIEAIAERPDAVSAILADALRGLLEWEARYGNLVELYQTMGAAVDTRLPKIAALIRELKEEAERKVA